MNTDKTYQLLVSKMQEVSQIPPQEAGPLTHVYKRVVPYLKYAPWKSVVFVSMIMSVALYVLFGFRLIRLASILQFGF